MSDKADKVVTNEDVSRRLEMLINAVYTARTSIMERLVNPRRDINRECEYPEVITPQMYQTMYERNPIAARVVELFADESWQSQPTVYETEDPTVITPFERAWMDLGKGLHGEMGWYNREDGSAVWEYLQRIDEMSGIGQYGVLLLGFQDGKPLNQPVNLVTPETYGMAPLAVNAPSPPNRLMYIRCFPESLAQITTYETDKTSPRYGMPTKYHLTINDPQANSSGVGTPPVSTEDVHWSRIIHVAEKMRQSEIFAFPRQQQVFNNILDCRKMYGGSAEMYWRGAFPGLSFETPSNMGTEIKVDRKQLIEDIDNYMSGLTRAIALVGLQAKSLAPQVVDPTPQIMVQIQAICIYLGVPMRIFMGSERGQLASGQDEVAWQKRLRHRRDYYLTPRLIVPLVNRLIATGVLPIPRLGFNVWWPDVTEQTSSDVARIALSKTQALSQYVQGNVESVITPLDYFTRVLGMKDDEALAVVEAARSAGRELTGDLELEKDNLPSDPASDLTGSSE